MADHDSASSEGVAADELKAFIERLERLEEEKAGIADDIKEVFAEAKGRGFDTKAIRTILRIRKQDHAERQEQEAILELYMQALGMLADTPLGRAAADRDLGRESTDAAARRVAADPAARKAVKALGTPKPLTDAERARGAVAAFEKGGTRMSIQVPGAHA